MRPIKFFEKMLKKASTFLKCALALLWMLWAIPISSLTDYIKPAPINVEAERKASQELIAFYNQIEREAQVKNTAYGPKDYFTDLKRMDETEYQIKKKYKTTRLAGMTMGATYPAGQLQELIKANLNRGKFSSDDISREAQKYSDRNKSGGPIGDKAEQTVKKMTWAERFQSFVFWLVVFYPRSVLLMLLLYIIRMAQRRGILETILAGKKQFIFSTVAWPGFFWRYPFNIVREVVVATELRRIGKLFRRFTSEERQKVRNIAESDDYCDIMATYRKRCQLAFARSFWIALLPALMLYFFVPVADAATDKVKKARDAVIISAQSIQNDSASNSADDSSNSFSPDCEVVWEKLILVSKECKRLVIKDWLNLRQVLPQEIDCIPDFGCEVGAKLTQTS